MTTLELCTYVTAIEPERDRSGNVRLFAPQGAYEKAASAPLHRYGSGPFCRFRIPSVRIEGVYALVVDGAIQYVGECANLSARFNTGYGQISPRKCYVGGQSTNCKINRLIFKAAQRDSEVGLWFFETENRKQMESKLIAQLKPPWNGRRDGERFVWGAGDVTVTPPPVSEVEEHK